MKFINFFITNHIKTSFYGTNGKHQFRLDETVKKTMEEVCREMGLSMSTAFNIFAKTVCRERPYPLK